MVTIITPKSINCRVSLNIFKIKILKKTSVEPVDRSSFKTVWFPRFVYVTSGGYTKLNALAEK